MKSSAAVLYRPIHFQKQKNPPLIGCQLSRHNNRCSQLSGSLSAQSIIFLSPVLWMRSSPAGRLLEAEFHHIRPRSGSRQQNTSGCDAVNTFFHTLFGGIFARTGLFLRSDLFIAERIPRRAPVQPRKCGGVRSPTLRSISALAFARDPPLKEPAERAND